jgi:hypothetical protein
MHFVVVTRLGSAPCRASGGAEVVTWLDAIAERSRSTPVATLNIDDCTESSTRTPAKANASSCARVSLDLIFMEISLRKLNPLLKQRGQSLRVPE